MRTNEELVGMLKEMGAASGEVAEAMLKYPRAMFLPKSQRGNAYYDLPIPIGEGQTCSAPSMVAVMISLLNIKKGAKILEVGTGCAWQTAMLSHIAGKNGKIVSIDVNEMFISEAKARFLALEIKNTEFLCSDGRNGSTEKAPYDGIIVGAACDKIYPEWENQLAEGGVIVLPLGMEQFGQHLYKGVKKSGKIALTGLMPVQFVGLQ